MTFGISAATLGAIVGIAGVAVSAYTADQSKRASDQAADAAAANADQQEQQFNKLNGVQPDVAALSDENAQAAKSGPSGTLLTGPTGVDPSTLTLGRSTLLGGATPTGLGG